MRPKIYHVYILASGRHGTFYAGITNDLRRRVYEHRTGKGSTFVQKYNVKTLVYYEGCEDVRAAIEREKQLKKWKRAWKIRLIETQNPQWRDLYLDLNT